MASNLIAREFGEKRNRGKKENKTNIRNVAAPQKYIF